MTQGSASEEFYARLTPFREFEGVLAFDAYASVPEDWVALTADIQGSTQAIAAGRYKDVNMVGAAVITAVLNACTGLTLPYSFGGDGGLVLVPGTARARASAALQRLQAHSQATFGLSLRAAAVSVARLRAEGHQLSLRKLALNGSNHLAMFAGSGVARLDEILKDPTGADPDLLRAEEDAAPPDLEGLSCRWEPLQATRSQMIALIVQPEPGAEEAEVLRAVLARLTAILAGDLPTHAPARDGTLVFRWPPRGLRLERQMLAPLWGRGKAWAWTLFTALAQKWCHLRGAKLGDYDGPKYFEEIKLQTDFRKYDGCFRTVLDCSVDEIAAIRAYLEDARAAGRLVFGLHADRKALMTCLVFSLEAGEHVHFIDSAGGGFARAAEEMKAQMAKR